MALIKIDNLKEGVFIDRPNRYLANVMIDGEVVVVHVHDPGRLKELLYPLNKCLVKYVPGDKRKTQWDMIAAQKADDFVLVHSGYHRYIAEAILKDPSLNPFGIFTMMRAEAKYGQSRIDFLAQVEKDRLSSETIWVEVKGCSLSEEGVAKFPDAPTVRGTRHLEELMHIKSAGDRAGVLLLVLSDAQSFVPKRDTDPKFYEAFYRALRNGVEIFPVKVLLKPTGELEYNGLVPIKDVENE
jgi:sugar fermentation stimulation protein A